MSQVNTQPECLAAYVNLLENYLKKQMSKFYHKYKELEQTHKNIIKNYDIEMYTVRVNDEPLCQEDSQEDQEIRNDNLLYRIQQYNRIAKPNKSREKDKDRRNRRYGEEQEDKPKRKVRTTITPAKLQEMNRIFKEYLENQEKNREAPDQDGIFSGQSDRQAEYGSLKVIGQRLGLGYSTILHKFREYRATRKVKGGALIASINQKRKYKKSREIEQLIQRSLGQSTFYTAVQLSKYIQTKYTKTLSRSIISRHLGQMGYSYKNIKSSKPVNRNTSQVKQLRKNFAVALALQRERFLAQVYYLDQLVFSYDDINKKLNESEYEEDSVIDVHVTLLASARGLIRYQLATSPMQEEDFACFVAHVEEGTREQPTKVPTILIMDMDNPVHFADKVLAVRSRMKQQNVRIFYQPPFSQQLNLLEWLWVESKRILSGKSYGSFSQFREQIQEILGCYSVTTMENHFKEAEKYLRRSMIMQNF